MTCMEYQEQEVRVKRQEARPGPSGRVQRNIEF